MEQVFMRSTYPKELNYVLYFLHGLSDVRNDNKYEKLERYIKRNYDSEKLDDLYKSVVWGLEHPEYDFKKVDAGIRQSAEEINIFLNKLCLLLESVNKMAVSKVKYINSNDESFEAIFTYNLDGTPSLSVTSDEFSVTSEGTDIFDCFDKIRNELGNITFICFGAHKYCYPSGMCRSMGSGLLVYYLEMGIKPDRNSIRGIFDFDENESETLCVPISQEQKIYLDEWFKSC